MPSKFFVEYFVRESCFMLHWLLKNFNSYLLLSLTVLLDYILSSKGYLTEMLVRKFRLFLVE